MGCIHAPRRLRCGCVALVSKPSLLQPTSNLKLPHLRCCQDYYRATLQFQDEEVTEVFCILCCFFPVSLFCPRQKEKSQNNLHLQASASKT